MSEKPARPAAVLIDFENIYYFLKNQLSDRETAMDTITDLVQQLKKYISENYGEQAISLDAYADFDRIEEAVQSDLYLLGVETHNVLGTDHKNAADMRLCIDALDIMHTRTDIHSFILVAGDRDYIPLIQYLKKRGRYVRVVGFPQKSVSGDLITIVGPEYFIDAHRFVPELGRQGRPGGRPMGSPQPTPAPPPVYSAAPPGKPADELSPVNWERYEERALEILTRHFSGKPEVWLTPYLHKLREELPELTDPERKRIVSKLKESGAFRIEKRPGVPNEYSVILLNWNHPLVQNTQA